ncbi:P-loop containing nucleoside triphosphate hydrolase protein [Xylariomycetidae sp. FL2044]|nr:P-loop containing nucleoside triphosphate hydrolase protein [Xylariomycetidae sp. FL2044]
MAAPLKTAAAAAAVVTKTGFVPRTVFEVSSDTTRSYYLGHHASALMSMRKILSNVSLILECRDSRVPLTAANPRLEEVLSGRDRIVVYTKSDLCCPPSSNRWLAKQAKLLTDLHNGSLPASSSSSSSSSPLPAPPPGEEEEGAGRTQVLFTDERQPRTIQKLIAAIKRRAAAQDHHLVGMRALVVGMPNAGKSTLLNALRRVGMQKAKAARTGAEPGVTRKLSTPVRVVEAGGDAGEGVFLVDTPGVFIPYVGDVEAMLKLSLVGCVKDGLVPAETVADYLLFRLNLRDPALYAALCPHPTNDVREFLDRVALRTGKLGKGGVPSRERAADWVVQQWRKGQLGRFGLDDVSEEGLRAWFRRKGASAAAADVGGGGGGGRERLSMNQARRREKEARKAKSAAKRQGAAEGE